MRHPRRPLPSRYDGAPGLHWGENMSKRSRLLAVGAVVAAGGLVAAGMNVASAAAAPPPLAFVAATKTLAAERYVDEETGEGWVYLELGTHVVAGKDPLEIRVNRTSYAKPVVAKQAVWTGGKKTWKTMPAGMVTGFTGLEDFTAGTSKDEAGKVVKNYSQDFCPNAYASGRTRPDAPADNPYPRGCAGENPFLLGAVWGVQAGWSAPTDSGPGWDGGESFDLTPGSYTVTVAVAKKYADYFKIPAKSASATMNLT